MGNLDDLERLMEHMEGIDAGSIQYEAIYGCERRRHLVFMIGLYVLVDALLEAHARVHIKDIISYFEKYGASRREVLDVLLSYSMENYARITGLRYEDLVMALNDKALTVEDILGLFSKDVMLSEEDEKML